MSPPTSGGSAITAIGGGHGLAATLAALRRLTDRVTAVVSLADDGGSSGRLRSQLGVAPPGDLRKALVALADPASPLARAMTARFDSGELAGHAFGNLLIATLAAVEGDLVRALAETLRLVGGNGAVLPATTEPVVLQGTTEDGAVVCGQVAVMGTPRLARVATLPADPEVPDEVLAAIDQSDAVVLGPGSLFTSVLAAAATPALVAALTRRRGPLVYVCNLRPQEPETSGMDVAAHVAQLRRHGIEPDVVLYDPSTIDRGGLDDLAVGAPLAKANGRAHDPAALASALAALDCWPGRAGA